jgi:hypothetical protein
VAASNSNHREFCLGKRSDDLLAGDARQAGHDARVIF